MTMSLSANCRWWWRSEWLRWKWRLKSVAFQYPSSVNPLSVTQPWAFTIGFLLSGLLVYHWHEWSLNLFSVTNQLRTRALIASSAKYYISWQRSYSRIKRKCPVSYFLFKSFWHEWDTIKYFSQKDGLQVGRQGLGQNEVKKVTFSFS